MQLAARTVQLNQSIGDETTEADLNAKVKSKGNLLSFKIFGSVTEKIAVVDTAWCISVVVSTGTNKASCIAAASSTVGEVTHGSVDTAVATATTCNADGTCRSGG